MRSTVKKHGLWDRVFFVAVSVDLVRNCPLSNCLVNKVIPKLSASYETTVLEKPVSLADGLFDSHWGRLGTAF